MSKKGHYSIYGPAGDLMVKINVRPHEYFKWDNYDILTDSHISVSTAILGGVIDVWTLNGTVKIEVSPGT